MTMFRFLCTLLVLSCGITFALAQTQQGRVGEGEPAIRLETCPVVAIGLDMINSTEVYVQMTNTNATAVTYCLARMEFSLHDAAGKAVTPVGWPMEGSLEKSIKVVGAGETVRKRFPLGSYYDAPPGRYEVRYSYAIESDNGLVTSFGVTPMTLSGTALILELREE